MKKRFRAKLETDNPNSQATFVAIPFDVPRVFGTRARVPVRGTINGFAFRGSLAPYGGRHYLGVTKVQRAGAKVMAGDSVTIVLERDTEPRTVKPPPDLARALRSNPAARAAWEKLSYTHRKEYASAIESAAKAETRARRVEKAIAELLQRK